MPPTLTRFLDDARPPSAEDYDPARITLPLALLLDGDTSTELTDHVSAKALRENVEQISSLAGQLDASSVSGDGLSEQFSSSEAVDLSQSSPTSPNRNGERPTYAGSTDALLGDNESSVIAATPTKPRPRLQLHMKYHVRQSEPPRESSVIRLANTASGRIQEVKVQPGSTASKPPTLDDVQEIDVSDITHLISSQLPERLTVIGKDENSFEGQEDRLCEAVLRSVFAQKLPRESSNESLNDAGIVKEAFALSVSAYGAAEARAIHVASYRRAEVQARLDALQNDQDSRVNPSEFDDQSKYLAWKEEELGKLSELVNFLGTLPSFSGSVQVDVISAEELRPANTHWFSQMACSRRPPSFHVYSSVTILPSKTGSAPSDLDSGEGTTRKPAFLTEVVICPENAEWQCKSPWIPINSMQDKILVEVWERVGASKVIETDSKQSVTLERFVRRRGSKSKKVAPMGGDLFLGQVVVSFSHIESQALAEGGLQGMAPATSYMLADEKGRQHMSTIQLQFACSSEHYYRDAPQNKLLLNPPVDDIAKAYDNLVRLAYQSEKEGYQLSSQWKKILSDFAGHYRIRKERCSLGLVNVLAGKFQHNAQYFSVVVDEWLPVCNAGREGRLTKSELTIHSHIGALLVKPAVEAIENFQTTFSGNQPPGALSKLLELIGLILCWDPNPKEILIPLQNWIQASCERRLHRNLFCNPAGQKTEDISLQSLVETLKLVREDIIEHGTIFRDTFPVGISLPAVTAPAYYKLVSQYARSFIVATPVKTFTKSYGDLASQLMLLHNDIERIGVRITLLDVHNLFRENIVQWLTALKPRMIDWASSSISTEKWEPLSPQTKAFFSFSVVDLYFMMGQVVDELTTRLLVLPFGKQYVWHIEVGICAAVQMYVGVLEKLCLQELPKDLTAQADRELHCSCISKTVCVKMNNLNATLHQQRELESSIAEKWEAFAGVNDDDEDLYMEESSPVEERFSAINNDDYVEHKVGGTFKELKQTLHRTLENVIGSIVENIQWRLRAILQNVLSNVNPADTESVELLQPLTEFMDQHILVMNEWLHPLMFRRILKEIAGSLFFCMEEFALNKDEDPNPMTPDQRKILDEILRISYDYFYGDGLGIDSSEIDRACTRLRKILACWDLNTRELCSLYWQAWDEFNRSELEHPIEEQSQSHSSRKDDQVGSVVKDKRESGELHVLDYLWLLKQRRGDEEAEELVLQQSKIATNMTMQYVFGLPRDEVIVASFACRNAAKKDGTLYITAKHVGFVDANVNMAAAHDQNFFLLPFERLTHVETSGGRGSKSLVFVSLNSISTRFTKFGDTDIICRAIFKQVAGSGLILEKNMAPMWLDRKADSHLVIKELACSKQGVIRKNQGTLLVSTTHVIFERKEKHKTLSIDHGKIIRIHAERKGLRSSGVVIETKDGKHFEFVDFINSQSSVTEIAQELDKLVMGGSVTKSHI